MGVKCLAQEHNAVPRPGLEPGPSDPESSALTIRPPHHPHNGAALYLVPGQQLIYDWKRSIEPHDNPKFIYDFEALSQ